MTNFHKEIVNTLKKILPTHYEMLLHRDIKTPCISYMELANQATEQGDTLGYSLIQYQVKVWSTKVSDLQEYAIKIDAALRPKGWKRTSSNELHDRESTMMQKILVYEAQALEQFEE